GYSLENVRAFCRAQQAKAMTALRGEGKKYLPDLHVRRDSVEEALARFVQSDAVAFVIGGDSGVGKTCETCASAEALGEDHLVLFWNGAELAGSLSEAIASEFNWYFSDE